MEPLIEAFEHFGTFSVVVRRITCFEIYVIGYVVVSDHVRQQPQRVRLSI